MPGILPDMTYGGPSGLLGGIPDWYQQLMAGSQSDQAAKDPVGAQGNAWPSGAPGGPPPYASDPNSWIVPNSISGMPAPGISGMPGNAPPWLGNTVREIQGGPGVNMPWERPQPQRPAGPTYAAAPGAGPPQVPMPMPPPRPPMQQPGPQEPPQAPQAPQGGMPSFGDIPGMLQRGAEAAGPFASEAGKRLLGALKGFANGNGYLGGIANAASELAGETTDPGMITRNNMMKQYAALIDAGLKPAEAKAAILNPEIMKQVAGEHFGGYKVVQTGEDPIAGKQFSMQGPGGKLRPLSMAEGGGGGAAGGSIPTGNGILAPGVNAINHNLTGDAYLAQFGPEVQAAVKAYIAGDVMPTGNPRRQSIANAAKLIAQTYANQMGIPVSDALYSEKRKYRQELGSTSPNTAGGQGKAFEQGISHMAELATRLEALDNSNGFGNPYLSQGFNAARQAFSNTQAATAKEAASIGQTLAGEVGKLFSGAAGGGVHERELTRQRFSTITSKPELAAALQATLDMMRGGLTALENRRDEVMGPNSGIEFKHENTKQNIKNIEETIARLKGEMPAKPVAKSGWKIEEVK